MKNDELIRLRSDLSLFRALVEELAQCSELNSHTDIVVVVGDLLRGGSAVDFLFVDQLTDLVNVAPIEGALAQMRIKLGLLVQPHSIPAN